MPEKINLDTSRRHAIGYMLVPSAFAILAATGALFTGLALDWPVAARVTAAIAAFLLAVVLATIPSWVPATARFLQPRLPAASNALWTLLLDKPSATTKRRVLVICGLVCAGSLLLFALWPDGRTWSLVGISMSFAALLAYYGMKCCRNRGNKGRVFVAFAAYLISLSANYLSSVTVRDETGATLGFAVKELKNLREDVGRANRSLDNLQSVPEQLNRIEQAISGQSPSPREQTVDTFEGVARDALRVALAENAQILSRIDQFPIPVNLNDNRLDDVLKYLGVVTNQSIEVDWDSLSEVGVDRDLDITFQCDKCTLEQALDGVFISEARRFARYLRDKGSSDSGVEEMYRSLWGVSSNKIVVRNRLPAEANVPLLRRFSEEEDPAGASRKLVQRLQRGGLDISAEPKSFTTAWFPLADEAIKRFRENPRFCSIELGQALRSGGWSMIINERWSDAERLQRASVEVFRAAGAGTDDILGAYHALLIVLDQLRKTDDYRQILKDRLALARSDRNLEPSKLLDILMDTAEAEFSQAEGAERGRALYAEALNLAQRRGDTRGRLSVQVRRCGTEIDKGDVRTGMSLAETLIGELETKQPGAGIDRRWIDETLAYAKASYGTGLAKTGSIDRAREMFDSATELVLRHNPEKSMPVGIVKFRRKQSIGD